MIYGEKKWFCDMIVKCFEYRVETANIWVEDAEEDVKVSTNNFRK